MMSNDSKSTEDNWDGLLHIDFWQKQHGRNDANNNSDDSKVMDNELVSLPPRKRMKTGPRPYDNVLEPQFFTKSAKTSRKRNNTKPKEISLGSETKETKQTKKPRQKFVMDYGVEKATTRQEVIVANIDVLDDPYMGYGTIVKGRDLEKYSLSVDGFTIVPNTMLYVDGFDGFNRFPFQFVMQHLHDCEDPHKVNQTTDMWDVEFNGENDDVTKEVTGRWMSKMDKNFHDPELKTKVIDFFLFYFLQFNSFIDIHCFHCSNSLKNVWHTLMKRLKRRTRTSIKI